jgi:hypothetical protein
MLPGEHFFLEHVKFHIANDQLWQTLTTQHGCQYLLEISGHGLRKPIVLLQRWRICLWKVSEGPLPTGQACSHLITSVTVRSWIVPVEMSPLDPLLVPQPLLMTSHPRHTTGIYNLCDIVYVKQAAMGSNDSIWEERRMVGRA